MNLPTDDAGHPLCPIDGECLSGMTMGLHQPTVYKHRDGSWHLDPLSEVVGVLTLPEFAAVQSSGRGRE